MEENKRIVFKDKSIQKTFDEKGYVKLDLLTNSELNTLRQYAQNKLSKKRKVIGFAESMSYYISIFDEDVSHKEEADALIKKVISEKVSLILNNYECFYSNFMIKYPGDDVLEAHQDFNLVDDTIFTGLNLWCPLIDTNEDNGGLYFIPGSNKLNNYYRGPNIPFSFTSYQKEISIKGVLEKVNAGECLIFDHRTIHYSNPNLSSATRYAIQSVLKPKESEPLLYIYDINSETVEAKFISSDFIIKHGFWSQDILSQPTLHKREYVDPLQFDQVKQIIT